MPRKAESIEYGFLSAAFGRSVSSTLRYFNKLKLKY